MIVIMIRLCLVFLYFVCFIGACSAGITVTIVNCTLCSDPSHFPNDPEARINALATTITCQELYDRGTLEIPVESCTALQNIGRDWCLCGETTTVVDCSLCSDPTHSPHVPEARVNVGLDIFTCQELYDRGTHELSVESCSNLQSIGRDLCLCEEPQQEAPHASPKDADCTLCQDGSVLEQPLLEVLPGRTCAELQVDAQREYGDSCKAYQGTYGLYCGCNNTDVIEEHVCRLCGNGIMLPDPYDMQDDVSCGALEFQASLPDSNCAAYREEHSVHCCDGVLLEDNTTTAFPSASASPSTTVFPSTSPTAPNPPSATAPTAPNPPPTTTPTTSDGALVYCNVATMMVVGFLVVSLFD